MPSIVKQNLYSVKIATYNGVMARLSKENKAARTTRAPTRRVARAAADRPTSRRKANDTPYHHGDLREALLKAAERVLERDGLAGLTLRAVAREAGVSHAAPTHHFGDLTGLLSELAAIASAWSLVHGFTMLLLDGRLKTILDRAPAGTSAETLLSAMLGRSGSRQPRP